ncbi:MAG: tRNA epoxyqueuosine(34) reductase QueG [Cyanobium sp.]
MTASPLSPAAAAALALALKQEAGRLGFDPVGLAAAAGSPRLQLRSAALERWLAAGHQAGMGWMEDPRRRRLEQLLPEVRSVLAVALPYYVKRDDVDVKRGDPAAAIPPDEAGTARAQPDPSGASGVSGRAGVSLRVARYGWGRDYHRVIDRRLRQLGRWLEAQVPSLRWRACVDSAPLLEKAWAEEAGLGWIGKNGNLIHRRRGSWLLLGHLLTSLELPADRPAEASCGACSRCLDACPTGALPEPFVVDARRCIAYHTIENRDPELPQAVAAQLHGWVAGCDICQEVCPWNGPDLESSTDPDLQPRPWLLDLQGPEALRWSEADWDERLRASALRRIRPWMWRRNIRTALGLPGTGH